MASGGWRVRRTELVPFTLRCRTNRKAAKLRGRSEVPARGGAMIFFYEWEPPSVVGSGAWENAGLYHPSAVFAGAGGVVGKPWEALLTRFGGEHKFPPHG